MPGAVIRPHTCSAGRVDPVRRGLLVALAGGVLASCAGRQATVRLMPVETAPVLALLNGFRAGNGLAPLSRVGALDVAAERQALAMAEADRMSHSLSFGDTLPRRVEAAGYQWQTVAENLGMGYHSLEDAFAGWKGSSGHRANLLKANATEFGIAHAWRAESRYHDYWALVLGAPRVQPA